MADARYYHIATEQKYTISSGQRPVFVGKYQHTRAVLDYTCHAHYEPARQLIQDSIVDTILTGGVPVEHPWIVYTAGAMGAGKSYTVRYLNRSGAFPLDRFVQIDPDKIKGLMPDMPDYIKHNRENAAYLTHKESGFIAEIIEREAMLQSKPVVVDGSLRNSDWYASLFGRFRAEFPKYKIAILLVQAPPDKVHERAKRRAAVTGREVGVKYLDDAIVNVPRSFSVLKPLVDFTAVMTNNDDGREPHFEPPVTLEAFKSIWAEIEAAPHPSGQTVIGEHLSSSTPVYNGGSGDSPSRVHAFGALQGQVRRMSIVAGVVDGEAGVETGCRSAAALSARDEGLGTQGATVGKGAGSYEEQQACGAVEVADEEALISQEAAKEAGSGPAQ